MSSTKERGVLLLIDEAFIDRLDRETAIVEAAQVVEPGKKRPKIARTTVMRDMLRIELDRRAIARGEKVPTAEPLVFEAEATPIAEPVVFAAVAVNVGRENETAGTVSKAEGKTEGVDEVGSIPNDGDVSDDRGDVVDQAEEGSGEDGAAALTAEIGPPPERVTPGRMRGTVRKVGVRKA